MTADELRQHAAEIVKGYRNRGTRDLYRLRFEQFCDWYEMEGYDEITDVLINDYAGYLDMCYGGSVTVNHGLLIMRKIISKLADDGLVDKAVAYHATTIKQVPQRKIETVIGDNSVKNLLSAPNTNTVKGVRDRALLSVLLGCGLKTSELAQVLVDDFRTGHLSTVDGSGNAIKVPIVEWVYDAVSAWLALSAIESGPLFPALRKGGYILPRPMNRVDIWHTVRAYASSIGLTVSPRDLRRNSLALSANDEAQFREEIAKLNNDIRSLRRALKLKANLTPDRLSGAVVEHWGRRDID